MTSVAVISSAVARIKRLKKQQKQPEILPNEADELLQGLEGIEVSLVAAYDRKTEAPGDDQFAKLEKQVVRLSYEIVDAIVDGPLKPKEKFSASMLTSRRKTGNTTHAELQGKLNSLDQLKKMIDGESSTGSEENAAGPEKKRDENFSRQIQQTKSINKTKKKNPARITAPPGPEIQGEEKAGPEQKPESAAGSEKDLLHEIKEELLNPSSKSSEVYLVGEGGMGKTTLAMKLFNNRKIREKFNVFCWVPINQNFQIKRVLKVLLQQLGCRRDMREMNEIELIVQIFDQLKNKTYLIVLDDIGAIGDLESIRLALPVSKSSRVIITTSSNQFDGERHRYKISGLTQPQILSLLKKKASFKRGSKKVRKAIFDISGGSPLYATILGKSLQPEAAATDREHKLLHELHSYKPQKGTPQVLGASYKRLAPELKPCLLYMGQFPQGQDIEVDKLYLLLVAENLLSPKEPKIYISPQSLRDDLDKLARLKLVRVQKDKASTSRLYKSCRLHEQVREFCKSKGLDEEFLQIVELGSPTKVGPHTRRLAIHLSKCDSIQFDSHRTMKKILSLLIFDAFESSSADQERSEWPSELHDLTEFIHLRILNFDGVNLKARKIPRGVDRLFLLRYLSFRGCWLKELPSCISRLTQLETLDLLVHADCKMLIPNNILTNMKRMLHLYLPRLYESNAKSKMKLHAMERLEILVNLDTEIFDVAALSDLKNLKILSTISKGQHSKDLDIVIDFLDEGLLQQSSVEIKSFDCYNSGVVAALKKLLRCQFLHSIHVDGQIVELPKEEDGGKVAEMVLDGSLLERDPMGYLGKFQNLRSLVLSNDAFLGREMVVSAAPLFPNLRSLKLQKLQYLEKLTIEKRAMPELSTLQIDECDGLLELSIPEKLCDRLKKKNGGSVMSLLSEVVIVTT